MCLIFVLKTSNANIKDADISSLCLFAQVSLILSAFYDSPAFRF